VKLRKVRDRGERKAKYAVMLISRVEEEPLSGLQEKHGQESSRKRERDGYWPEAVTGISFASGRGKSAARPTARRKKGEILPRKSGGGRIV